MSNVPGEGGIGDYANRYNDESKQALNQSADMMRRVLISGVFRTFQELLIEDIITRERLGMPRYKLWLTNDTFEIPGGDHDAQSSMAFAVQSEREPSKRLRFHVPIPDNFDSDSVDAVGEMQIPEAIYAERKTHVERSIRHKVGKTAVRYAIDAAHTYTYESIRDTQTEERIYPDDKALLDEVMHYQSGLGLLVQLQEDLINWQRVHQLLIVRANGDNPIDRRFL